jgi:alpha-tubulin suppressor-like RCC1 family protein
VAYFLTYLWLVYHPCYYILKSMQNFTLRMSLLLALWLLMGMAHAQRFAAGQHTAVIHSDGTLWTWGLNAQGQLGIGNTAYQAAPVQVGTDTNWKSVAVGQFHTVAIRTDGTLWAWGLNNYGQLGVASAGTFQTTPVQIGTATTWRSVSAGYYHTLALRTDGTLWAWGFNYDGEVGIGTTDTQLEPAQVGTATNWQSLAAGAYHSLAVRTDGTLWAWGYNYYGQLGLGSSASVSTPVQVGTATTWQRVSAGYYPSRAHRWHLVGLGAEYVRSAWAGHDG